METIPTQVCVRIRPFSQQDPHHDACIERLSDTKVACTVNGDSNLFTFDRVLDCHASQQDTYKEVRPIVEGVLGGNNGAILTYGQTGSGKTHTLIGVNGSRVHRLIRVLVVGDLEKPGDQGIAPRAIGQIIDVIQTDPAFQNLYLTISAVEIYCERLFDLLEPTNVDLQVKQDAMHGVYIGGLVELTVANKHELNQTMTRALTNRTVSATSMNAMSSRSHCLFYVHIIHTKQQLRHSTLCMVDLAGSERQTKAGTTGLQLDEGILINKSLSALANVICALTEGKSRHIPYRESKLTRVLQNCIGGNSQMTLIVCCSPSKANFHETVSSLRFGCRAKGITNTIQNASSGPTTEQELQQSYERIESLKAELDAIMNRKSRYSYRKTVAPLLQDTRFRFVLYFFAMLVFFFVDDYITNQYF